MPSVIKMEKEVSSYSVTVGKTVKPVVSTKSVEGHRYIPENSSYKWTSSNTNIAAVNSSGVVTGKNAGTVTITAANKTDPREKVSFKVTVTHIVPTKVSLNKTSVSILKGKTLQLTATVAPSNATDKTVTWKSSNTKVATVSTTGKVTAKAAGTATITCTTKTGSKKATAKITVTLTKEEGVNEFVERCYTKALGRKSDAGGKKYWVNKILKAKNIKEEALRLQVPVSLILKNS